MPKWVSQTVAVWVTLTASLSRWNVLRPIFHRSFHFVVYQITRIFASVFGIELNAYSIAQYCVNHTTIRTEKNKTNLSLKDDDDEGSDRRRKKTNKYEIRNVTMERIIIPDAQRMRAE